MNKYVCVGGLTTVEVNYKNKKPYNTSKLPIRQPKFMEWLLYVVSKVGMPTRDYKIEKIESGYMMTWEYEGNVWRMIRGEQ